MKIRDLPNLELYLKKTLAINVSIEPVEKQKLKVLPIAIAGLYEFATLNLYNHNLLLVISKEDYTVDRLKKHFELLGQSFEMKCVAIFDAIPSFIRTRLIEKGIPFIVVGKQLYMPNLLIDLKDFGNTEEIMPSNMQPSAQLLLLYHLQIESLEGLNFSMIADKLQYNGMTITRAAYYLHHIGICSVSGTKDKSLNFNYNKKELWEKAEPLMASPIKQIKYFNGYLPKDNLFESDISALAFYSNLNPDIVDYYAVRPGYFQHIGGANLIPSGKLEGNICIEEWKYNPYLLTKSKCVDPLSLFLCLRNDTNERIQMALEQMMNNITW